jgi:4-amino-4-deoxy-L-arabinose transferase-like glycosyltransferase
MVNKSLALPKTNYWFLLFIFIHILFWTLAPILVRFNLPMDAIEGATWGHQLEWGYDKNPFMNGWLTALAVYLGGQTGWTVYLFSQLSVALGFWALWEISKKMLPPVYALLSVLLLEGVQYYNFHAIDFNDNTLEVGIWGLTILFFYRALSENNTAWNWMLTGLFAGLGIMTKYYTALLLLSMLLLLLRYRTTRQLFKKPAIYCGGFIFIAIITPHFIWLCQHDFVTLNYAVDRVSSPPAWLNHIFYPTQFVWQQFETILPAILLLFILLIGRQSPNNERLIIIRPFDKAFLWYVGAGPLLLTIILSAVIGIKLRAGWGQPLFSLWGIIFIFLAQPTIDRVKFYRFMMLLFSLMGLSIVGYATALIRAPEPSSANFPGKIIARTLTDTWQTTYHTPLQYIAGTRWIAGNIAFYSKDKPTVYIDWNKKFSPWIDEPQMKKAGAIFVWDLSDGKTVQPAEIKARFPGLSEIETQRYAWLRNKNMPPIEILVAWLAPTATTKN